MASENEKWALNFVRSLRSKVEKIGPQQRMRNDIYFRFIIAYLKELTNDSNDVEYVVRTLADQYLVQGLASQSDYDNLLIAFKADLPDNYYAEGLWNLDWDPNFISVQMSRFFETFKRLPDITLG